jgi:hypothetical protein
LPDSSVSEMRVRRDCRSRAASSRPHPRRGRA